MANNTLVTRLMLETGHFDSNLRTSRRQIEQFDRQMKSIGSGIMATAGALGVVTSAVAVLGDAFQKNLAFEKAVSGLQSLTGMVGEDLEYIAQQAIRLGSTTTQSANQVAEAFTNIGGKMSELLNVKEALVSVTESAITLAEAANIDVTEAANALTGALNQMGKGAAYANDYINILAAASMAGAAEIPYLNAAIERAGGTASACGVQFNELVAAIEAIAPKVSEASQAGTYLRNIFLTLESSTDQKLRPSVVGLGEALTELANRNLSATEMTKMFGKENVTAALAIVNAKDEYLRLEQAITGTNTAFEQQRINTDNLQGAITGLKSAWEGFILNVGQNKALNWTLAECVAFAGRLIEQMTIINTLLFGSGLDDFNAYVDDKNITSMLATIRQVRDQYIKDEEAYYKSLGKSEDEAKKLAIEDVIKILEKESQSLDKSSAKYNAKAMALAHYKAMLDSVVLVQDDLVNIKAEADTVPTTMAKEATKQLSRAEEWEQMGVSMADGLVNEVLSQFGGAAIPVPIKPYTDEEQIIDGESPVFVDNTKIKAQGLSNIESVANSLNSTLAQTANLLAQSGNNWAAWGLQTVATISSVIGQYASLIAMQMTSGVAEQSKLPFPYNIAAMAATAGGLISVIASLPKFATGGIVGGTSFNGDNVLIRANSGEAVLTKRQQARMMSILDGAPINSSPTGGAVSFEIKGDTLVGVLNNYNRKHSRVK